MSEKYKIDLLKHEVDKKAFLIKIQIDKNKTEKKLTSLEKDLDSNFKQLRHINSLLSAEYKKSEKDKIHGFASMQKKIEELQETHIHIKTKLDECMFLKTTNVLEHTKTKLKNIENKKELKKCLSTKNSSIFHKYAVIKSELKKNLTN